MGETNKSVKSNPDSIPTEQEILERIKIVDSKIESPANRAEKVWKILRENDLTTWDVLCFCVEWLGLMSQLWDWLMPEAKSLAIRVNNIHYWRTSEIFESEKSIKFTEQNTGIRVSE